MYRLESGVQRLESIGYEEGRIMVTGHNDWGMAEELINIMRYLHNILIVLMLGLPVTGIAKSYTMGDLCGCYHTDDSNIILYLSADGTFSIQLYSPNDILIGKWEVKNRTILLNSSLSPRDSITIYNRISSDMGFSSERSIRIEDHFSGKPNYYFKEKAIKILNVYKLFYGYSIKAKRHSIKFKRGPKIYLIRNNKSYIEKPYQ